MLHVDDILTQRANIKFVSKAMKQPLLSLKDEKRITKLWSERKDVKSLHVLINSYEKLVISNAIKFRKFGLPFGDLLQEGNVGILKNFKIVCVDIFSVLNNAYFRFLFL